MKKLLLLVCLAMVGAGYAQETPQQKKIVAVGLDTLEFSSNVFYIDELAFFNNTTVDKVIELYNRELMEALKEYEGPYAVAVADSADKAAVHVSTEFIEIENENGEPFVAIAPAEGDEGALPQLIEKYDASYALTINAYQIYAENPPEYVSYNTRAEHIIHYDIFDSALNSVYAGKFALVSFAVEHYYMASKYADFAKEAMMRITAYERALEGGKSVAEVYRELQLADYKNASLIGLQIAFDGPYGGIGGFFSQFVGTRVELNGGLGFNFSGFKAGAGAAYYLDNFGVNFRPFIGLNYSYSSGNTFEIGGETDEAGNQIDPQDVSKFRIFSDHAIHLKGGLSYRYSNTLLSLAAGYSFPFLHERPALVSGKISGGRRNFVNAMAPGGLEVTFNYSIFINR